MLWERLPEKRVERVGPPGITPALPHQRIEINNLQINNLEINNLEINNLDPAEQNLDANTASYPTQLLFSKATLRLIWFIKLIK